MSTFAIVASLWVLFCIQFVYFWMTYRRLEMLENPYKEGSFAYQQFNTFFIWYINQPTKLLEQKRDRLRQDAQEFSIHSWKAMQDFEFEANVIDLIIRERA